MSKVGETINDADIQTYLRTGGHPDPGKAAWCAMFVGASLTKAGIRDSGSDMAVSYKNWGSAVNPRMGIQKGDVIIETHGGGRGHVGLLTGQTRFVHGREQVEMVSGNHGHMVRKSWDPVGGTNVIRRATDGEASPSRRSFGHPHGIGHHPATMGRAEKNFVVEDHTGGMVTVVPH